MGTYTDLLKMKAPPVQAAAPAMGQDERERVNARAPEQAHTRTGERASVRTPERRIGRQSYNVFADQHEALKRLEAQGFLSGNPLSLSEMVRQALDDYLRKHA